jgi:diguanylate cyclase (GGDEF)-like protein/PAS domain S-box-containing protein
MKGHAKRHRPAAGSDKPDPVRRSVDRKLRALLDLSHAIAASRNLGQLVDLTFRAAASVLEYSNCAFLLVNEKTRILEMRRCRGYASKVSHLSLPVASPMGITAWVAREGEPLRVDDVRKEPRYIEGVKGALSELAVPLKVGHRTIGVFDVQRDRPFAFTHEDELLLMTLANYAAIALGYIRFRHQISKTRKDLETRTGYLNSIMASSPDPIFAADLHGRIVFLNPAVAEVFGYSMSRARGMRAADFYADGEKEAERVMNLLRQKGKVKSLPSRCRRKSGETFPVSLSASLLKHHGEVVGSVGLLRDVTRRIELEQRLEQTISALRRANHRLEKLAVTDHLSGLYNRVYFYTKLREEMKRATEKASSLALLLVDLDDFKSFNDVYGHLIGDKVIEQSGELISAAMRRGDYGFRYGGEEFVLILPDASYDAAGRVAAKVIEGYPGLQIFKRVGISRVSLSVGIARFHPVENNLDMESLVREADEAMYQAKRKGGGCAVLGADAGEAAHPN